MKLGIGGLLRLFLLNVSLISQASVIDLLLELFTYVRLLRRGGSYLVSDKFRFFLKVNLNLLVDELRYLLVKLKMFLKFLLCFNQA